MAATPTSTIQTSARFETDRYREVSETLVLGAGAIGMTTAIALAQSGLQVKVLHTPRQPTSSFAACAVFLPYFGAIGNANCLKWAQESWVRFDQLASDPAAGVRRIEIHEMFRRPTPPDPILASVTDIAIVDSLRSRALPAPYQSAWRFSTWLIETPIYLPYLRALAESEGVRIEECDFEPITSVGHGQRIVNCAGFDGARMFHLQDVLAVRGQTVLLEGLRIAEAVAGDEFIVAPRSDGLLVGSYWQEGDEYREIRDHEVENLKEVAVRWGAEQRGPEVRVVASHTGLRPYRQAGPLVAEDKHVHNVVHNTGHGGAGITLSWGCANQVLSILTGRGPQ